MAEPAQHLPDDLERMRALRAAQRADAAPAEEEAPEYQPFESARSPEERRREFESVGRQTPQIPSTPAQPTGVQAPAPQQDVVSADRENASRFQQAIANARAGVTAIRENRGAAVNEVATVALNQATAQALKWSWLLAIETVGLSLLYTNIHFVAKYMLSIKGFCEFGDEWAPKGMAGAVKSVSGVVKYAEFVILFVLDMLVVLILGSALAILTAPATQFIIWIAALFH